MKKQPEITEKTRQAFVAVFCELYAQKPIEKISIQEIANRAGYNRSTFYQYFTDIYELLEFVENDMLSYIKEELSNREVSTHIIQDALNCFSKKEHIAMLKALLGNYGSVHFLERLRIEIPLEKLDLKFSANDSLTPYLIEFYISTCLSLFRLWVRQGMDLSSEELFELADSLYTNGITAYSGIKKH